MPLIKERAPLHVHPSCGKRWGGYNTSHCCGCHETFSGITAFDKHRAGGKCRKPDDVGMVKSGRAYDCWTFPSDDAWWEVD